MTDETSPQARLRSALPGLTRAENQLATRILAHYPMAALGSVAALARDAGVSGPTVVRMVQKLGYRGFPQFQEAVREELGERLALPVAKREKWADSPPDGHPLHRFAQAVTANLQMTLADMDPAIFDALADRLADPGRRIFVIGGRITQSLADYLAGMLRVMRGDVVPLSATSNTWPPALLDMKPGDLLVVYDIRRYESAVLHVAELAREQGAEVAVITDQWISPAATLATHVLTCRIEAPSAWDSIAAPLMLTEALVAAVQSRDWQGTRERLTRMERLYARAQMFRRGT